jgi:hypothetical protein
VFLRHGTFRGTRALAAPAATEQAITSPANTPFRNMPATHPLATMSKIGGPLTDSTSDYRKRSSTCQYLIVKRLS